MKEIYSEILIAASPERVWHILMDFNSYPAWNPFITRIRGEVSVGSKLSVFLQPPGGRGMEFRPVVLVIAPDHELRWKGKLLMNGIFDGKHVFMIEPNGNNGVRFIQKEIFKGVLAPIIISMIGAKTREGFHVMNVALKARAEKN